jgi:hypothetical protein
MKLVILHSVETGVEKGPDDLYLQELDTHYAPRVIGNLRGKPEFCTACAAECTHCRDPYHRDFSSDIIGVFSFPAVLPYVLEKPEQYVPPDVPPHDALLAIQVHDQILLEMLKQCPRWNTKCVIVPREAPDWMTHSARTEATALCKVNGVEIAFPKPFCGFRPSPGTALAAFRDHFRIGYPEVELTVENGKITKATVIASGACGSTYYIARWLIGRSLADDLVTEVISKRLHSFPCTASMERDPELGDDTPLHIAGQAHNMILAKMKNIPPPLTDKVLSPHGTWLPKAPSPTDTLKNIARAKAIIMESVQATGTYKLNEARTKAPELNPAAFISAALLLKKEGRLCK